MTEDQITKIIDAFVDLLPYLSGAVIGLVGGLVGTRYSHTLKGTSEAQALKRDRLDRELVVVAVHELADGWGRSPFPGKVIASVVGPYPTFPSKAWSSGCFFNRFSNRTGFALARLALVYVFLRYGNGHRDSPSLMRPGMASQ